MNLTRFSQLIREYYAVNEYKKSYFKMSDNERNQINEQFYPETEFSGCLSDDDIQAMHKRWALNNGYIVKSYIEEDNCACAEIWKSNKKVFGVTLINKNECDAVIEACSNLFDRTKYTIIKNDTNNEIVDELRLLEYAHNLQEANKDEDDYIVRPITNAKEAVFVIEYTLEEKVES